MTVPTVAHTGHYIKKIKKAANKKVVANKNVAVNEKRFLTTSTQYS